MKTAVSLFAGIGGFDLALERNGVKVVAAVEIDKKASAVLAKHFPNTKLFGDIQEVTGEQLIEAGFDPRNGIFTGGFPCQDLSVAGKRAGLVGKRSGLFWEICRLLEETKAESFILENVPGLLSSNEGRDMAAVVEALVELGYGIAWRVLDAQYFGVPQRRRRVFIVGCLGNGGAERAAKILAISESRRGYLEKSKQEGQKTSRKTSDGSRSSSEQIVGTLAASDYKFLQQQQAHENKIVIQEGGWLASKENIASSVTSKWAKGTGGPSGSEHFNLVVESDVVRQDSTAYSFDSLSSNSMKSSNPNSGCREVDIAKTIDTAALNPSANQGGMAIVQSNVVRKE